MTTKRLLGICGLVCLAAAGCSSASTEEAYLQALTDAELFGEFTAARAAVSHAERICEDLDAGSPAEGSEVDLIAVEHYCDDFAEPFRVLEEATVTVLYGLIDSDTVRADCEGRGGYSDIGRSTAVVVRNIEGDELARDSLGTGVGEGSMCAWTLEFDLIEGEEIYIVALASGRRGEVDFSWEELRSGEAGVTLGSRG